MTRYICLPIHRSHDEAFLNSNRICIPIEDVRPPLGRPGPDPYAQLKALGTIAQLAASLSDLIPMRQQLVEISEEALRAAVNGLGDDFQLVDLEVSTD